MSPPPNQRRTWTRSAASAASGKPGQREGGVMRLEVSPEAVSFVSERGGRLWVWAAHPRVCCWGTPAYMYAATEKPRGITGFRQVPGTELQIWFRAPGGRVPDVLEIGLHGRWHPRVEAYWDGCRTMM